MSATVARPSWRPVAVVLLVTVVSAAVAVYAFGAGLGWWGGSSCALAACGAEDIGWAWLVAGIVMGFVTGLFALLTVQAIRDSGRTEPVTD